VVNIGLIRRVVAHYVDEAVCNYGKNFDMFEKDAEYAKEYLEQLKEFNIWLKREPVCKLHNAKDN